MMSRPIVLAIALGADAALAYEVGADAYCCVAETTTRSLLWTFARAIERCQLVREHRRLVQNEQQRLRMNIKKRSGYSGATGPDCRVGEDSIGNSSNRLLEGEAASGRELSDGAVEETSDLYVDVGSPRLLSANSKSPECDLPSGSSRTIAKCCGHMS